MIALALLLSVSLWLAILSAGYLYAYGPLYIRRRKADKGRR